MKQILSTEEGFTGLEAAIVLIAFVVVAAVFSYVVLSAGFFATQESQEAVYTSVKMASSSLEVIGDVYGLDSDDDNDIEAIRFTLGLSAGGTPVDFSTVQMVFATSSVIEIIPGTDPLNAAAASAGEWNITDGASDTDLLLEGEDKFTIIAMPTTALGTNVQFNLEIHPSTGAAFGLKKTTPSKIDRVNLIY
ncbi:archaellin/type IV pilin N-terminal domain-containing protein [Methanogenium cariaci]|jgi:archaeal flagellin FlaB